MDAMQEDMNPVATSEFGYSSIEEFYRDINFNDEIITRFASEGAKYIDMEPLISDLVHSIGRAHITLSNEEMDQQELDMFNNNLFMLCSTYRENQSFLNQITHFLNHRIYLQKILCSNANELDKISFIIATSRLLGFIVEGMNLLNLGMHLGENVIESWSKISLFLEYPVKSFLVVAAYFGPICLIIYFVKYFHYKYVVQCSMNIVEEGKRLSRQLGILLLEKDNMQAIITELFLETIDGEFITSVESRRMYMSHQEKVFAAVLISNMKRNPLCIKDGKFLCKAYLFCRTKAAKEWFDRMLSCIRLEDQENDIRVLEEELLHLKMLHSKSSQPYGILILLLKSLSLPRFVLYGLFSLCLYIDILNHEPRNNYRFSNDLRTLALHSQKFPKRITAYRTLIDLRNFVFLNQHLF